MFTSRTVRLALLALVLGVSGQVTAQTEIFTLSHGGCESSVANQIDTSFSYYAQHEELWSAGVRGSQGLAKLVVSFGAEFFGSQQQVQAPTAVVTDARALVLQSYRDYLTVIAPTLAALKAGNKAPYQAAVAAVVDALTALNVDGAVVVSAYDKALASDVRSWAESAFNGSERELVLEYVAAHVTPRTEQLARQVARGYAVDQLKADNGVTS